jgi:hypothetical protein
LWLTTMMEQACAVVAAQMIGPGSSFVMSPVVSASELCFEPGGKLGAEKLTVQNSEAIAGSVGDTVSPVFLGWSAVWSFALLFIAILDAAECDTNPVLTSGPLLADAQPQAGRLWVRRIVPNQTACGI